MTENRGILKRVRWGVVSYPLPGESQSGDQYIIQEHPNGVLAGVVDGLGHGSEAAHAAQIAVRTLSRFPHESVISLVRRCHQELLQTRGVVMSLASFDFREDLVTWIAVGNVEGILARGGSESQQPVAHIVQRGGVVGFQLPQLHAGVHPVSTGDTLILATDGVRPDFYDNLTVHDSPEKLAKDIGERFRKESDDSLVLVLRCL